MREREVLHIPLYVGGQYFCPARRPVQVMQPQELGIGIRRVEDSATAVVLRVGDAHGFVMTKQRRQRPGGDLELEDLRLIDRDTLAHEHLVAVR